MSTAPGWSIGPGWNNSEEMPPTDGGSSETYYYYIKKQNKKTALVKEDSVEHQQFMRERILSEIFNLDQLAGLEKHSNLKRKK